jgi:hypothetical protein
MRLLITSFLILLLACGFFFIAAPGSADARNFLQQPTQPLPTVTSTVEGPVVTVRSDQEQFINVRSGPGIFYDKIGVILAGQQLPAKGRSTGGDWILVEYPGVPGSEAWVYAPFVNLTPGQLPIVEPPPTPTPLFTTTIDPTLAAEFVVTSAPTRLPTFTEPAPLVISTFEEQTNQSILGNIPMGWIVVSFAALGILIGLFAWSQGN